MRGPFFFKIWSIVGVTLTAMASIGFAVPMRTEIQIFPFSEVPAQQPIRLGLIAGPVHSQNNISNNNSDSQFEKIEDLEILGPKKAGDRQFLGRVEIARLLQEKLPTDQEYSFRIPNQVIIESKHNLIPSQDVAKKISDRLKEKCPECRFSIRELKIPEIQTSERVLDWNIDDSQVSLRGSVLLPLVAKFQNGSQQTFWINTKISIEQNAMVARRDLKIGEHVMADDYELKWIDVTYQRESPLREGEVKNQILSRYISTGRMIVVGDMKREPATVRGQIVKVIAGDNDLEVSIQATAEEQGSIGDMVKVKLQDSQKFLSGKVIDKGVVKIQ